MAGKCARHLEAWWDLFFGGYNTLIIFDPYPSALKKTKQLVWLQFCGCCGTARLDRNHGTMLGEGQERSCHVCLRMGRMGMSQPPRYRGGASKITGRCSSPKNHVSDRH